MAVSAHSWRLADLAMSGLASDQTISNIPKPFIDFMILKWDLMPLEDRQPWG
jgi:hypothetical protein